MERREEYKVNSRMIEMDHVSARLFPIYEEFHEIILNKNSEMDW